MEKQIYTFQCQGNKLGTKFCTNRKCSNFAVLCGDQKCKCFLPHVSCMHTAYISQVIKKLNHKNVSKYTCFDTLINYCESNCQLWKQQKHRFMQMKDQRRILLELEHEIKFLLAIKENHNHERIKSICTGALLFECTYSIIDELELDITPCNQQFQRIFGQIDVQITKCFQKLKQQDPYLKDTSTPIKIQWEQQDQQQRQRLEEEKRLIQQKKKQQQQAIRKAAEQQEQKKQAQRIAAQKKQQQQKQQANQKQEQQANQDLGPF